MLIDLQSRDVLTGETVTLETAALPKVLQVAAGVARSDGGPATAALNINRTLREIGSNSLLITTDADGPTGRLPADVTRPVDIASAAVLYSRRNRPHSLKNSWSLGWRTLRIGRSVDVMHVHGVYLANSIYAYLASRLTGTPYVLQPHGTLEPYQQSHHALRKGIFNSMIGHRIVRGAAAVIAASQAEMHNVKQQYPEVRVDVVPLGVTPLETLQPDDFHGALGNWLSVPREQRVIFLGRLARKKRPDLLVEAWGKVSADARLLFVGPEQDWDETRLRQLLPKGEARVSFLPAVEPAGVAWCLTNAGIFVLPSENENFGIAVAEAMSYGCAIITTAQTAANEHVRAAKAGDVLETPDRDALAASIETLLNEPSTATIMGKRGVEYAADSLRWANTGRRLLNLYKSVSTSNSMSKSD